MNGWSCKQFYGSGALDQPAISTSTEFAAYKDIPQGGGFSSEVTSINGLLADYKAVGEEVWSLSWPETSIQSIDLEGLITCVV